MKQLIKIRVDIMIELQKSELDEDMMTGKEKSQTNTTSGSKNQLDENSTRSHVSQDKQTSVDLEEHYNEFHDIRQQEWFSIVSQMRKDGTLETPD